MKIMLMLKLVALLVAISFAQGSQFLVFRAADGKIAALRDVAANDVVMLSVYDPADYKQHWELKKVADDEYEISNRANGTLVLDVSGFKTAHNTPVVLWRRKTSGDRRNQRWGVIGSENNILAIESKIKAGKFLRVGASVGLVIQDYSAPFSAIDGYFTIGAIGGKVLAVQNFNAKTHHFVEFNLTDYNQQWLYLDGFISNRAYPSIVLDVSGAAGAPGTKVLLWTAKPTNNANQRWKRVNAGGLVMFESQLKAGLFLRLSASGAMSISNNIPAYGFSITYIKELIINNALSRDVGVWVQMNGVWSRVADVKSGQFTPTTSFPGAKYEVRDAVDGTVYLPHVGGYRDDVLTIQESGMCESACGENEFCYRNASDMHTCKCAGGYSMGDGLCEDFDECAESNVCGGTGSCENLFGSSLCECGCGSKLIGAWCQPVTMVHGVVLDASTGMGIAGALVSIPQTTYQTFTDANGWYAFDVITTSSIEIAVSVSGYNSNTAVDLNPGLEAELSFELLPVSKVVRFSFTHLFNSSVSLLISSPNGLCNTDDGWNKCGSCGVRRSESYDEDNDAITDYVTVTNPQLCSAGGATWKVWLQAWTVDDADNVTVYAESGSTVVSRTFGLEGCEFSEFNFLEITSAGSLKAPANENSLCVPFE